MLAALLAACVAHATAAATAPATTLDEVLARNAAARGGVEAWHQVETLAWIGHTESSNHATPSMPFVMQMKRPNLVRFEIRGPQTEFTRIFDGTSGWKRRRGQDGRLDLKPFSAEEIGYSTGEFVVDGPLLDYQAKGVRAVLDGLEDLEGHKAYRLSLSLPSGAERTLWIDARTNLEVRYDRPSGNPLQRGARIATYYREFRSEGGLQMPHRIEVGMPTGLTRPDSVNTLVIEKVLINPSLPAITFARPAGPG